MPAINFDNQEITAGSPILKKEVLFYKDVVDGLSSTPKYLQSKYFYDIEGDRLFQGIMNCQEYYPFNCELEIFSEQTKELANAIMAPGGAFNLIELGAGDCTKSSHLLKHLVEINADFTYMPIDISTNIIDYLKLRLPVTIPGINISGLNGEYFDMLEEAAELSYNRKVVMFLGSNLGNMLPEAANEFCCELRSHLRPGDLAIIGVDLKKHPATILAAYNDKGGITKDFNLNLLKRINRELSANFDLSQFGHYPVYDPETGSCKSYLISLKDQEVTLATEDDLKTIRFTENEQIFMEISQKYTVDQVANLADQASFIIVEKFFDRKKWFVDAIWEAV
jgi:L-histidine N-alpha-methyltransferase